MIIAKLYGGMGNQMFQYALGRHLAIKNKTELKLDISFFENYDWHDYSLAPFNIIEKFASKKEVRKYTIKNKLQKLSYYIRKIIFDSKKLTEPHFNYFSQALNYQGNIYTDGYWQSYLYFKDIAEIIKKDFTIKIQPSIENKLILTNIVFSEAVSIHIRRGNYVTVKEVNDVLRPSSLDYYNNAISFIKSKVTSPVFYIFSDDIDWAKQNIMLKDPHYFVDNNNSKTDYEDIRMMSSCKHNIIANSTFSWWGSWLNQNPHKKIIAPKTWFGSALQHLKTDDIYTESMLKI